MNLPHLPPIRFAQKVLSVNEKQVKVECEFPSRPTLAMYLEAAAQSSAGFKNDDEPKIGFVVTLKEIELLQESASLKCVIEVQKEMELGAVCEFSFNVYDANEVCLAKGIFTVMIAQ